MTMWGQAMIDGLLAIAARLGIASFLGVALSAQAGPAVIASSTTTLKSTADRMISYRQQDHMWHTSDGATHVLINRGGRADGRSLSLNSSFDGGSTWTSDVATLPSTGTTTTSDGYIVNDDLHVTYSGQAGDIRYTQLRYDSAARTWTVLSTQVVYTSAGDLALTPALAADALGRIWLAFTNQNIATSNYSIKMMRKDLGAENWVDTGFVFGEVDNLSNERSARPVALPTGMGLVYTVHQDTYWAQRNNAWGVGQAWSRKLIYANQVVDKDPYGSHFSVVADAVGNLHMALVDGGKLIYSRFDIASKVWATRALTGDIKATYVQALVALGNIVLVTNNLTRLRVYQSSDSGTTFANTHALTHPAGSATVIYDNPRVEAPAIGSSPFPVLQQYVSGSQQRLLFFAVPVVR